MTPAQKGQVKALRRLILADVAFGNVIATCDFVLGQENVEKKPWYNAVIGGICVEYMRPFMSGDGVGPLPTKYEQFPHADFQGIHDDLKAGRNWAFAHNDPANAATLLPLEKQVGHQQLLIKIRFDGTWVTATPQIIWEPKRLKALKAVCGFQKGRLFTELNQTVDVLRGSAKYPPGEYVIGESFP